MYQFRTTKLVWKKNCATNLCNKILGKTMTSPAPSSAQALESCSPPISIASWSGRPLGFKFKHEHRRAVNSLRSTKGRGEKMQKLVQMMPHATVHASSDHRLQLTVGPVTADCRLHLRGATDQRGKKNKGKKNGECACVNHGEEGLSFRR